MSWRRLEIECLKSCLGLMAAPLDRDCPGLNSQT
jgi:hypothetical protein